MSWLFAVDLLVLSIVRFATAGDISGVPIALIVLPPVAFILLTFWLLSARNEGRLKVVKRMRPDAFAATVEIYPDAISQVQALVAAFGGEQRPLQSRIAATLCIDDRRLDVLGGTLFGIGGSPKVLASFALPAGTVASAAPATQGFYVLKTLQIDFGSDGGQLALNLLPIRTVWGLFPWRVSAEQLTDEVDALNRALQLPEA
ncbi:hypothetical protein [Microbacterium candidum]|uniref:Uncharacterized protein n=1 Tax=Microbacterium candidum TaxID=3041922 RepID=A0ABT7MV48_9MICO|nr:hypothetical protein [Microbacterium sp. ASV49]MDL9978303.1 hypothetical protein [Microbacterium sp. ASV49]